MTNEDYSPFAIKVVGTLVVGSLLAISYTKAVPEHYMASHVQARHAYLLQLADIDNDGNLSRTENARLKLYADIETKEKPTLEDLAKIEQGITKYLIYH